MTEDTKVMADLTEVIVAVELRNELRPSDRLKQALGQLKAARSLIIQDLRESGDL